MAILPLPGTKMKSASSLRRTLPRPVAKKTLMVSHRLSSSGSGMTALMFSPSARAGNMLIMARPRAWGVPSGRR